MKREIRGQRSEDGFQNETSWGGILLPSILEKLIAIL
jgi:hypothetical protein